MDLSRPSHAQGPPPKRPSLLVSNKDRRSGARFLSIDRQDLQPFFTSMKTLTLAGQQNDVGHILEPVEGIDWNELQNVSHLADGGMCRVYSCTFRGVPCVAKTPLPHVADPEERLNIVRSLEDEVKALRLVPRHPNIIEYYGSGTRADGEFFILLERLQDTLSAVIETANRDPSLRRVPRARYTLLDALKWSLELCHAMAYLHDSAVPNAMVLHRDLKPENLGLSLGGRLKLIDLGLAVVRERAFRSKGADYAMSGGVGSLRYMAPEVTEGRPYNEKADVHSFAMILWELLAHTQPYEWCTTLDDFLRAAVRGHQRPKLSPRWPPELRRLLAAAWAPAAHERPAFRELVGALEGALADEVDRVLTSLRAAKAAEEGAAGGKGRPRRRRRLRGPWLCGGCCGGGAADAGKGPLASASVRYRQHRAAAAAAAAAAGGGKAAATAAAAPAVARPGGGEGAAGGGAAAGAADDLPLGTQPSPPPPRFRRPLLSPRLARRMAELERELGSSPAAERAGLALSLRPDSPGTGTGRSAQPFFAEGS